MAELPYGLEDVGAILARPVPRDDRTVEEIRDELRRAALDLADEALGRLADLMRHSTNERVVRDCAVAILDRGGIIPPSAASMVNIGAGASVNILVEINRRAALEQAIPAAVIEGTSA